MQKKVWVYIKNYILRGLIRKQMWEEKILFSETKMENSKFWENKNSKKFLFFLRIIYCPKTVKEHIRLYKSKMAVKTFYGFDYHKKLCQMIEILSGIQPLGK